MDYTKINLDKETPVFRKTKPMKYSDFEMRSHFGRDWLRDLVMPGGQFGTDSRVAGTKKIIDNAYSNLLRNNNYSSTKLLAEMEFGVWKFMFNNVQFRLSGRHLLNIFPNKPRSTRLQQYNNVFIFNELDFINVLRNRVALWYGLDHVDVISNKIKKI